MNVPRPGRLPRTAAGIELGSLVVLLLNLATVHLASISLLAGPLHGCAYLFIVVAVARDPRRTPMTTALALLPGIGGVLALRGLTRSDATAPVG
ncbi:DUF3817 domain-containing protein [Streptomyces sp. NPDC001523]|uniref:DUF3817 domain-containing protein n=1 Tax=Streptomyces sp. NPDC001523 TaxID=3154383 RepID=UPI00331D6443